MECHTLGITLGYKIEGKEVLIEVPIDKDKDFLVVNALLLTEDGKMNYHRKFFETVGGKKLRNILS